MLCFQVVVCSAAPGRSYDEDDDRNNKKDDELSVADKSQRVERRGDHTRAITVRARAQARAQASVKALMPAPAQT